MNQSQTQPSLSQTTRIVPSFLKQTKWNCGYFDLPNEHGVRWFNPSIVDHDEHRMLAVRRSYSMPPPLGQNTIEFFGLSDKRITGRVAIQFLKTVQREHWEDPRVTVLDGKVFMSCCNFRVPQDPLQYHAHQLLVDLSVSTLNPPVAHVVYGRNGIHMDSNTGNEKNWTWFNHRNGWHFIYESWPHHVVQTDRADPIFRFITNKSACPWEFGSMRGGSPAVARDDLYWCFFHSAVDRKTPQEPRRRYYMGAYAFEVDPPFSIKKITLEPLLVGSEEDGGILPVIFPGGALAVDDHWLVVFGVNDLRSGWIEIPHSDLLERMIEV